MRNRLITFFVIAVSAVAAATAAPAAGGQQGAGHGRRARLSRRRRRGGRRRRWRAPDVPTFLAVSVVDTQGFALPGALVSAAGPAGEVLEVCSQGDGVYRSAAVRPGVWAVEAAVPGFATTAADLEVLHQPTRGASSPRRLARRSVRSKNARLAAYLAAEHLAGGFATGRTSGSRLAGEPIPRAGRSMLLRRRDLQQPRWTDRGRADPGPALGSDMGVPLTWRPRSERLSPSSLSFHRNPDLEDTDSFREALSELAVLPPESPPRGHRNPGRTAATDRSLSHPQSSRSAAESKRGAR